MMISFWGGTLKKPLRSVLLPTDTRHVLKFRKDPFRGVDGIEKVNILQNRCRRHIGGGQ